jgi:hypothetical protein
MNELSSRGAAAHREARAAGASIQPSRFGRAIRPRALAWMVGSLVALMLLASCGGGGLGSGGTGAPLASGSGTVTGFGSIIVDGVAYDDSAAAVQVDDDLAGAVRRTDARLGQQVEIAFDASGAATSFRVGAQLVGPVAAVRPLLGTLNVLGREVIVNADGSGREGPVTVFEGAAGLAGIAPGDWVEVHGIDAPVGEALQATRIERLAAPAVAVRVSGRITDVRGENLFRLAGSTTVGTVAAIRLPSGASWAIGQRVTVLARPSDVGQLLGETLVGAALVRVSSDPGIGQAISLNGRLRELTATSFRLGGWLVDFDPAVVRPPASVLVNGLYVRVEGEVVAPGRLRAREVRVRAFESAGLEIELRGTLLGLAPDGRSFWVRGVRVVVPAGLVPRNCGAGLTDGQYVEVKARVTPDGVTAEQLECKSQEPPGSVVTREGVVSAVNETARGFTLVVTSTATTQAVAWTDFTEFRDVAPTTLGLLGRPVEVEGVIRLGDGVLVARRVKLRN